MIGVLAQSGSNNWGHLVQLAVVFVAFGASAIGWIFRKLNEQAAIKRAKAARERQHEESLRTGRETPSGVGASVPMTKPSAGGAFTAPAGSGPTVRTISESDAKRRLMELAQRRRAELERLARQQSGEGGGGANQSQRRPQGPPPLSQPQRSPLQQGRPPTPTRSARPTEPPRRAVPPVITPGPSRPTPAQARAREQAKKRETQQRQQVAASVPPPAQSRERTGGDPSTHRLVSDSLIEAGNGAMGAGEVKAAAIDFAVLRAGGSEEFRRAFILSEVLREPVSMRSPDETT